MIKQLTLGVIGHVDHGKTALVRALTGIDTDRLKEEKERGLSIVLGFSYVEGSQGMIDLIDVPGHENFVRTMISGATGIDGALLVVAANEAIMPQTREHAAIAQMLGVDRGVIVVNKKDLVSSAELDDVMGEVRSFVTGTFLEDAEIVCVSALSGEGIDDLQRALERIRPADDRESSIGLPFLPIDRAFVMRGFGPVVTGTLRGAALGIDGEVELLPAKRQVTIRGLQVHNRAVERALPGQRVAVNLRHIKRENIKRGDVLTARGRLEATRRIDVQLELLDNQPTTVKNGTTVRFLAGTSEMMARIRLLDRERLEPGAAAFAQLRLSRKLTTYPNQRFILRSNSPLGTIGGGCVLEPHPARHRRYDRRVTHSLSTSAHGSPVEKVRMLLVRAGLNGTTVDTLRESLACEAPKIEAALSELRAVRINSGKLVDREIYSRFREDILVALGRYHDARPSHIGLAVANLRKNIDPEPANDVLQHAIGELVSEARIENHGGILRLAGFDPLAGLSDNARQLVADMEDAFRERQLTPTYRDQVVGRNEAEQDLFRLLCATDRLVILKNHGRGSDFVVHTAIFDEAVAKIASHFSYPQKFTVSEVRKLLGANRKFTVPLMEHLDATGVTMRIGNLHQLRARHP